MNTPLLRQPLARLDDHAIQLFLANPAITALLPCLSRPKSDLATLGAGQPNCQTCEAQKRTIRANAINMAKDCVISCDADTANKLKDILLVERIEIVKILPNGMHQQYTK